MPKYFVAREGYEYETWSVDTESASEAVSRMLDEYYEIELGDGIIVTVWEAKVKTWEFLATSGIVITETK